MDLYGNRVSFGGATVNKAVVREVEVLKVVEIGPVGCWACTSGDSPIFDLEQHILFGY